MHATCKIEEIREETEKGVCLKIVPEPRQTPHTRVRAAILAHDGATVARLRLLQLVKGFGLETVGASLTMPTWQAALLTKKRSVSAPFRRLIWLLWTWRFEPDRCRTWFDVVTWGKFCRSPRSAAGKAIDEAIRMERLQPKDWGVRANLDPGSKLARYLNERAGVGSVKTAQQQSATAQRTGAEI